jgi:pyruvate dehydrogenase E1 component beta subunit
MNAATTDKALKHSSNQPSDRELTYAEALVEAIAELMKEDPDFLVIGSYVLGLGPMRALFDEVRREYPKRVLDPPTAEIGFTGFGIGAAMNGLHVLVDLSTASFIFEAFPQVANEAANASYMSGGRLAVPVVFHFLHGLRGGGAAQHSHSPQAMLWNTPGLQIIMPSSPADVRGLLPAAIKSGNPTVFVDHSKLMPVKGTVPTSPKEIPLGVAEIKRSGSDVTVVATSYSVQQALSACEELASEGIEVELVDPRTVVPLDRRTILDSVAKTGRLVIVDETHRSCGVASEIAAIVSEEIIEALKVPIIRVTVPDVPVPFSPVLERELDTTPERIAAAVRTQMTRKQLSRP